ncbi:hypothetical protein [Alteromonas sp. C1M14]|uniref:hypothetical protein n=1 Tax=Alteromonas sp. C1M14 TaxID=2841567 RepID=UPI001C08B30C|nr:hypothetical protein [Alteromonas sp. C1M14]MBU2977707.1 hypothetical protein [Alteromonas sp. C1M14]
MSDIQLADEQQLQDYLAKKLSPEEEIDFENSMLCDPHKTEQVILAHTLRAGMSTQSRVQQLRKRRQKLGASVMLSLAAAAAFWIWLPGVLVTPTSVSPGIVYLEDFRSHVTEPVILSYAEGEAFKVVVSDAPPSFNGAVKAVLEEEGGKTIFTTWVYPNENSEISLLVYEDAVESGRYQLTLSSERTEINRFSLDVLKE